MKKTDNLEVQKEVDKLPIMITKTVYPLGSKKGRIAQLQELANESIKIQSQLASLSGLSDKELKGIHLSIFRAQLSAIEQSASAIRAIQGEDRLFQNMIRIIQSIIGGIFGFVIGKNWEKIISIFS